MESFARIGFAHGRRGAAHLRPGRRPEAAERDLERMADACRAEGALEAAQVDVVVAVNPGCLRQLRQAIRRRRLRVRALHLAELLAET